MSLNKSQKGQNPEENNHWMRGYYLALTKENLINNLLRIQKEKRRKQTINTYDQNIQIFFLKDKMPMPKKLRELKVVKL